jgi:hypothetical protein
MIIEIKEKDAYILTRMLQLVQIRSLLGDLEFENSEVQELSESIINQIKKQNNENNL